MADLWPQLRRELRKRLSPADFARMSGSVEESYRATLRWPKSVSEEDDLEAPGRLDDDRSALEIAALRKEDPDLDRSLRKLEARGYVLSTAAVTSSSHSGNAGLPESFFTTLGTWEDERSAQEILLDIRTGVLQRERRAFG